MNNDESCQGRVNGMSTGRSAEFYLSNSKRCAALYTPVTSHFSFPFHAFHYYRCPQAASSISTSRSQKWLYKSHSLGGMSSAFLGIA